MLLNCSRNCCLLINWGDPRRSVLAKLCKRRNCSAALPAVIGFRNTHHRFCCFSDSCDYSCSYSHIKQSFCQQTFWQQSWVVSAVAFPAPACSLAPCVGEGGLAVGCVCSVTQNGAGGTCLLHPWLLGRCSCCPYRVFWDASLPICACSFFEAEKMVSSLSMSEAQQCACEQVVITASFSLTLFRPLPDHLCLSLRIQMAPDSSSLKRENVLKV